MVIEFGSGVLFAKPVAGNQPTDPTPFKFGVLQEVTVDFKADLKKLYGQYQLAVATARGKLDVTLKGKLAVFDPAMLNQLYFAQASTAGYSLIVDGESHTVSNTNSATVTNAGAIADWGVIDATTGQPFTCMPNAAAVTVAGEYYPNVTSGVYSFSGADGTATRAVKISYTYAVNSGTTITIANQLMGYAPEIEMLLYNRFRSKYMALQLNDVTLGSINIPTKLEDFWIADFDGSANADSTNTLGLLMMDSY
jgi:hypothetical protein